MASKLRGSKRKCPPDDKEEDTKLKRKKHHSTLSEDDHQTPSCSGHSKEWTTKDLLMEWHNLSANDAENITTLFDAENTIPFICRYRKHLVGRRSPEEMRDIQNSYAAINVLKLKIRSCIKSLNLSNKLDSDLENSLVNVRSMEELDIIYSPYRTTKKTLADKARELGLGESVSYILEGKGELNLHALVKKSVEGLKTIDDIMLGCKNILSEQIFKNATVLKSLREATKDNRIRLESIKASKVVPDQEKFKNYWNFSNQINHIRPHQTLAIFRGEKLKALSVKLVFPDYLAHQVKLTANLFLSKGSKSRQMHDLFEASWSLCYSKKILPCMTRLIKSDLGKKAEKESILVFGQNLKQLLLTRPVKGVPILGIDPGFKHGCKLALISEQNELLATKVLPITLNPEKCEIEMFDLLKTFNCTLVAIGNGKGCREVEQWMVKLITAKRFHSPNVKYCVVNEQGASIYSCSDEAKKEFPNLDINLISAVSIARRLNDPLAEYVKIDPKHLGVGMYQHDVNAKDLLSTLNQVVSECVSEVGVDLNTASECLLKHIAGMTQSKAKNVIEYRLKHGSFKSRADLKKVTGIGEKIFTQCAGFIRIERDTTSGPNPKYNAFDATWLHPESYENATLILKHLNLKTSDIGLPKFICQISETINNKSALKELKTAVKVDCEELETILNSLGRESLKDYRTDVGSVPLFRSSIRNMANLKVGDELTGAVTNVTHFGSFVDVGVEKDALIHSSKLNGHSTVIGSVVRVTVLSVDVRQGRINLELNNIL